MSRLDHRHNNALNSSTAKQLYSFTKTDRFIQHAKTEAADNFYEIPSTRQRIGFSFGKSGRYQFSKHQKTSQSPPPGCYECEGDIEKLLKKREGIKILYGRQQCKSGNIFKCSENPGPGMYSPNPQITKKKLCRQMTLGKATKTKRLIDEQPLPGPGAYPIKSLILNQNKVLSKEPKLAYGKIIFPEIKPQRIKTQSSPKLRFPELTYKGDSSAIQSQKGFSITRAQRFHQQFVNENPGPGSYQKFSQFIERQER